MAALLEIDRERVESYARQQLLSAEAALPYVLDRAVDAARRAGRVVVEDAGQKLLNTRANVHQGRPATLYAGAGFSGDPEQANLVFDRWNEMLAEQGTVLRTFLRGEDVFREWIEEGFQSELEEGWSEEKEEEGRQLIESINAAAAERERQLRRWWLEVFRDWGNAAQYPWWTRALMVASFAGFGLFFGVPIADRLDSWWWLLVGVLIGLAVAQYGIRASKSTQTAPADDSGQ